MIKFKENEMLNITIAYKTSGRNPIHSECVVEHPRKGNGEDDFNFFWMLSQSPLIAEFQVRDSQGMNIIPQNFGWACDKWVGSIRYRHD
jgi:hypothetical protein